MSKEATPILPLDERAEAFTILAAIDSLEEMSPDDVKLRQKAQALQDKLITLSMNVEPPLPELTEKAREVGLLPLRSPDETGVILTTSDEAQLAEDIDNALICAEEDQTVAAHPPDSFFGKEVGRLTSALLYFANLNPRLGAREEAIDIILRHDLVDASFSY